MLGIQVAFIANTGSALDTVERGGEPRHTIRAAVRMPKRKKEDPEYGTQWVTLNFRDSFTTMVDYARRIPVGTRVAVFGTLRTSQGDDGRTFVDVDVTEVTALSGAKSAGDTSEAPF